MNKKELIDKVFQETRIRLDEDDPAFVIVLLNHLYLQNTINGTLEPLSDLINQFDQVTTTNIDNFVNVANEALTKFMQRTREIKENLEKLNTNPGASQAIVPAPATPVLAPAQQHEPLKKDRASPFNIWLVIPIIFIIGLCLGVSFTYLILR